MTFSTSLGVHTMKCAAGFLFISDDADLCRSYGKEQHWYSNTHDEAFLLIDCKDVMVCSLVSLVCYLSLIIASEHTSSDPCNHQTQQQCQRSQPVCSGCCCLQPPRRSEGGGRDPRRSDRGGCRYRGRRGHLHHQTLWSTQQRWTQQLWPVASGSVGVGQATCSNAQPREGPVYYDPGIEEWSLRRTWFRTVCERFLVNLIHQNQTNGRFLDKAWKLAKLNGLDVCLEQLVTDQSVVDLKAMIRVGA